MVILLKIKRRDFFQRDNIPILVSRTVKTWKFKLLYFRNETCYGNWNLYKDLLFVYLQPSGNKNSFNSAILSLQFHDVTVKTIYWSWCFKWIFLGFNMWRGWPDIQLLQNMALHRKWFLKAWVCNIRSFLL